MSYQEILFNNSNALSFNDSTNLNNNTYVCNYLPNTYTTLKLEIKNISLTKGSFIKFKFIFNNQYPKSISDVSKNYISEVILNNEQEPILIKYNDNNSSIDSNESHYIIQDFILKRETNENGNYQVLTKISKLALTLDSNLEPNVDILSIKKLENNKSKSYYNISYTDYYTNNGTQYAEDGYTDRDKMDVNLSSQKDEDIAIFDEFIVNLYNNSGHLIDTSGNEDDPSSNVYSKTDSLTKSFHNLIKDENYTTKIYPVIGNNEYVFNFSDFFRLKEIQIITNDTIESSNVKSNISSIQYKYDTNTLVEYSSIDNNQGINILNTSPSTDHRLQITTPNIYKYFKIIFNESFNRDKINEVKLVGDKKAN